jgi:hypothetical protein
MMILIIFFCRLKIYILFDEYPPIINHRSLQSGSRNRKHFMIRYGSIIDMATSVDRNRESSSGHKTGNWQKYSVTKTVSWRFPHFHKHKNQMYAKCLVKKSFGGSTENNKIPIPRFIRITLKQWKKL